MHSEFAYFFLNPALAVDLGMFELFRFQVEDLMLDVNCQDYIGLFFTRPMYEEGDFAEGQPLLSHALLNPDKRFFECLLLVANFEANPIIERDYRGSYIDHLADTFLHRLPFFIQKKVFFSNKIDLQCVAHMIKVKEVDLDVRNDDDLNPLEKLCGLKGLPVHIKHYVAKMLLSAGAEVTPTALELTDELVRTSSRVTDELFRELLESYTKKK